MKFNINMKFNPSLNLSKVNFSIVLSIAFLLAILYLAYMFYGYVYSPLFTYQEIGTPTNLVRVNTANYEKTVNFLESQENFEAQDLNLPRASIFQ